MEVQDFPAGEFYRFHDIRQIVRGVSTAFSIATVQVLFEKQARLI